VLGAAEGLDGSVLRLMHSSQSAQRSPFFSTILVTIQRSLSNNSNSSSGKGGVQGSQGGVLGGCRDLSVGCPKGLMSSDCLQDMLAAMRTHSKVQMQIKREADRAEERKRDMMLLSKARHSYSYETEDTDNSGIDIGSDTDSNSDGDGDSDGGVEEEVEVEGDVVEIQRVEEEQERQRAKEMAKVVEKRKETAKTLHLTPKPTASIAPAPHTAQHIAPYAEPVSVHTGTCGALPSSVIPRASSPGLYRTPAQSAAMLMTMGRKDGVGGSGEGVSLHNALNSQNKNRIILSIPSVTLDQNPSLSPSPPPSPPESPYPMDSLHGIRGKESSFSRMMPPYAAASTAGKDEICLMSPPPSPPPPFDVSCAEGEVEKIMERARAQAALYLPPGAGTGLVTGLGTGTGTIPTGPYTSLLGALTSPHSAATPHAVQAHTPSYAPVSLRSPPIPAPAPAPVTVRSPEVIIAAEKGWITHTNRGYTHNVPLNQAKAQALATRMVRCTALNLYITHSH
jgi:hypothetical protein